MRILLADNYDSFVHNIEQILREQGGAKVTIVKTDCIDLAALTQYDGIVFSPGPDVVDPGGKMTEILQAAPGQMPILGVCLGFEQIAVHFGGKLNNLKVNYHGLARTLHLLDINDPLFRGVPLSSLVGLYHSWEVDRKTLPSVLIPTAISEDRVLMAFRHKTRPVFGLQFHPESVITQYGSTILLNFLHQVKAISG